MTAIGGDDFLFHVQLMLQTIGINSTIHTSLVSSITIYATKDCVPNRWNPGVTVLFTEDLVRTADTYCFTEPKRGRGVFNGVLTGQCTEIYEWHSKDEYACCSLASINLKSYLYRSSTVRNDRGDGAVTFDFERLHANVKLVARGLDSIITSNQYPVAECKKNANKYRPIGIGVQGLANVFMEMRIPFLSPEAERLDLEIFETIYHAALEASCELAAELGPYTQFEGSPVNQGLLRMDLWLHNQLRLRAYGVDNGLLAAMSQYGFTSTPDGMGVSAISNLEPTIAELPTYRGARILSGRYDWDAMRVRAAAGTRNSLLIAPMPTVTTSILLGNCESFEPLPMNIYTKSTGTGKSTECNDYMVRHLVELGLWNDAMKNRIIANDGSLTGIESIPVEVQKVYETVWEMKQTAIMRRAAMRHVFIDQGQSLNIHLRNNSNAYLRGVLTLGWELGNNTGSYYIRTPPAAEPLKNNIAEVREQQQWAVVSADGPVCTPGCDSCGS
jgi:ribonucleotide reductase alpha subunit